MDFVHVHDIAKTNLLAARAGVTNAVYNIATGTETSLRMFAVTLLAEMDSSLLPAHGPARPGGSGSRRLADIPAAATDLGWRPTIELNEGLRDLVRCWTEQQTVPA